MALVDRALRKTVSLANGRAPVGGS